MSAVAPYPKMKYDIGDPCWIYAGMIDVKTKDPVLSPGTVVSWLDLPELAQRLYVIRMGDSDFMVYELRDALLMTDDPNKNMPFTNTRLSMGRKAPALPSGLSS